MKTLTIPLTWEYFDQIRREVKDEEFRLNSAYWRSRLVDKEFDDICLMWGYPKRGDMTKRIIRPWRGFRMRTLIHKHFGPNPVEVFAIKVN